MNKRIYEKRENSHVVTNDACHLSQPEKAVDTINSIGINDRDRVSVMSLCSFHVHASFLVFQVLTCSFVCRSLLQKTYFKEKRRRPRKGRSRKGDHLCWPIATMC